LLSFKTDENEPTISKKILNKNLFFVVILKDTNEKSRIQIRIINPVYESKDPSPSQNVTDPEHCFEETFLPSF
jgi:hypothetical protein